MILEHMLVMDYSYFDKDYREFAKTTLEPILGNTAIFILNGPENRNILHLITKLHPICFHFFCD